MQQVCIFGSSKNVEGIFSSIPELHLFVAVETGDHYLGDLILEDLIEEFVRVSLFVLPIGFEVLAYLSEVHLDSR